MVPLEEYRKYSASASQYMVLEQSYVLAFNSVICRVRTAQHTGCDMGRVICITPLVAMGQPIRIEDSSLLENNTEFQLSTIDFVPQTFYFVTRSRVRRDKNSFKTLIFSSQNYLDKISSTNYKGI